MRETNHDIKAINGDYLNLTVAKWAATPQDCFHSCSSTTEADLSKIAAQFLKRSQKCSCYVSILDSLIDYSYAEKLFDAVWLYAG